MQTILIIDDEEKLRNLLCRIISLEGYQVLEASDLKSGLKFLDRHLIDIVLCDVKLPDGNGVDFVTTLKTKRPEVEVILLTAYGNIPDGIRAMKNGAFDYITKGDDNDKIIPLIQKAMEKVQMHKRLLDLENRVSEMFGFDRILGTSPLIKEAIELAKKVAPTDTSVLLLGETGTGKEVFAQAIHATSKRAQQPFIALNCSAFSYELLESELFGHQLGAFTGAVKDKKGLIEEAHNGTLFLDEIGEMPISLQAKLLRFLETGEFLRVGANKTGQVNVRIIAATNRNLMAEMNNNHFREDLYYRLSGFIITLPSLRDRKKDIPLLANHFLAKFALKNKSLVKSMDPDFQEQLLKQVWKGNIRELKNVMERAVILADSETLGLSNLPLEMQTTHGALPIGQVGSFELTNVEKSHIQLVLNHTKGNKTETARLLNIGLSTLYRKIEEYGLS